MTDSPYTYRSVTRNVQVGAHCNGVNHTDSGEIVTHDRCGAEVVRRDDNGNLYDVVRAGFYQARKFQCWRGAHQCDSALVAAVAAEHAAKAASGKVVKNVQVEVFKGRKVPKGTVGVVFWEGGDTFSGKPKVGIRDAAGATHWLLAEHCKVVG